MKKSSAAKESKIYFEAATLARRTRTEARADEIGDLLIDCSAVAYQKAVRAGVQTLSDIERKVAVIKDWLAGDDPVLSDALRQLQADIRKLLKSE